VAEERTAEKITRLEREIELLKKENERLLQLLEEALRAAKRQAAPFSRHKPKAQPQKPGRKAGKQYGRRYRRPLPDQVDEIVEVPLPAHCPRCGGGLEECETVSQFQTEIPEPRVERIEFRISVGRCRRCRRRVQGRHPRQTSDALGSASREEPTQRQKQ
jgi:transposase